MLKLSDGDKQFIKLHESGVKPSTAFREAYPEHDTVVFWNISKGKPEHQKAKELLRNAAQTKLRTKYIADALATYTDKMEEYSKLSLETATDLVQNARSEKVRADLAIEGIRHKVGTPVQKVALNEKKVVILQFGSPPEDVRKVVDGEIIDQNGDV